MANNELDEDYYIDRRCPICSSLLLSDGKTVWCSLLEGKPSVACEFGHDQEITIDQLAFYLSPSTENS